MGSWTRCCKSGSRLADSAPTGLAERARCSVRRASPTQIPFRCYRKASLGHEAALPLKRSLAAAGQASRIMAVISVAPAIRRALREVLDDEPAGEMRLARASPTCRLPRKRCSGSGETSGRALR